MRHIGSNRIKASGSAMIPNPIAASFILNVFPLRAPKYFASSKITGIFTNSDG